MKQNFVTFYSAGTFVHEETTKPIEEWEVTEAQRMAGYILERHNATPFAFQFSTRERKDGDLDSHESSRSARYYLGGKVETLEEVKARATDADRILISNMEGNGWDRIITNSNSWKVTQPLEPTDIVLKEMR